MALESPAFSNFRQLMDLWDENSYLMEDDSEWPPDNFSFFFVKDGQPFGAPEESRLVFARMKNPEDKETKKWADEATFAAVPLNQIGQAITNVFGFKDLGTIKVTSKEDAEKLLKK